MGGLAALPANAATVCTGDVCVIVPDMQTPLGTATVTVTATNVTVNFVPTVPHTLVIGIPFTLPPVAGCPGGCVRTTTTFDAIVGVVNIDTIVFGTGTVGGFTQPNLAIISLMMPPGPPSRVQTLGNTVVFTPAATRIG